MGHTGDIYAACGDVGRDHDFVAARLESLQRLHALVLGAVRVQDGDGVVRGLQSSRDAIRSVLGAGEDYHTLEVGLRQQRKKQLELLFVQDREQRVIDRLVYGPCDPDFHADWIGEGEPGHGLDLGRYGCRKE